MISPPPFPRVQDLVGVYATGALQSSRPGCTHRQAKAQRSPIVACCVQGCLAYDGYPSTCRHVELWSKTHIYVPPNGDGGAIHSSGTSVLKIVNTTFRDNDAPRGKSLSVRVFLDWLQLKPALPRHATQKDW